MALVVLSVVEQRLDAVRAVLSGAKVTEVAMALGVSRQSLHTWITRYLAEGLSGLADRSHRPSSCPHQVAGEVEVTVAEMRRQHSRWGAKRIRLELLRCPVDGLVVPSERTINRILTRQGLISPRPRKRPRDSYRRWQRPGPMQLWQIDIVGGVMIRDTRTGELREAKVVTGVDDHSRFCVIATVTERATGRAVCLALAAALARYGVPEEILSDNGKQFTGRFGKGGEVLFDKICRKNGITHRLTAPASPTTTGKIERFHGTLRRELLNDHSCFPSVAAAQAVLDAWVAEYNTDRPHQSLDGRSPVTQLSGSPRCHPLSGTWSSCGCQPRSPRSAAPMTYRSPRHLRGHRPLQPAGKAGRWSSTESCLPRGTYGWPVSSSGSAPPGPAW